MENLYVRNSQQDSDNSYETALWKARQGNDSDFVETLLKKKLITAVEDENKDSVKSLLDEFFKTSYIIVKSWRWSSDYHHENHENKFENKFELLRDAICIAMERDTKHSEEIMNLLLDCVMIWSPENKMSCLLSRLVYNTNSVEDKNLHFIEMLLKSGKINVNAKDEYGCTALYYADDEKYISLLVRYGADVNKKDQEGQTPILRTWRIAFTVLRTTLKEARTLVDLDAVDCNGRTALMIAAHDDRPDVVKWLLNAGASVNLSDHLGFTALHHALCTRFDHFDNFPRNSKELKKRKEIFTILFDAKDVEIRHKPWDLYWRNKIWNEQRIDIVKMLLLRPDIDVNALSFDKFSPLDIAEVLIPQLPSSITDALIKKGAVLNVFRQTETQPTNDFHLDVRCRLTLQRLLSNVCEVNAGVETEKYLSVDLFEKRLMSLIEVFQDRILSGKDQQGRTALHLVAIFFSIMWAPYYFGGEKSKIFLRDLANKIVKAFITIGCSVNEIDIYGRTPLHYANIILKDSLISHGADASIKDKEGKSAIDEIPQQKSKNITYAIINRNDETCFLRLMNNKQMEIEVDSQVRTYDDREFLLNTVTKLLWEEGEYAFRHPLVQQSTKYVRDLMDTVVKEIERLDPRFSIRPEFVGSSNENTKLDKPNEFDFCFVLAKISELCEVSRSPELPTGFVRLKRKPTKVGKISDFDSFFGKDGILNTDKLNWQFTTILRNALINIESQQSFEWYMDMPTRIIFESIKKVSNITMIIPPNFTFVNKISIDIVPCIHVDGWWPDEAISNVSNEINIFGCNLVFDRPQKLYPWVPYSESCARISFAKAESDLIKQSCDNAREAYMMGKRMIKTSLFYCQYTLKNCLLYCIEALTPTSEKASQLGLSFEELISKFIQMDRYLWLKCLMKCNLEFVSQDFCPCYFLPNFSSPIGGDHFKEFSFKWMRNDIDKFPKLCKDAHSFYRWTSNAFSESCCQLPAPDPLWERFDRNQLIASLCEIAYNNSKP